MAQLILSQPARSEMIRILGPKAGSNSARRGSAVAVSAAIFLFSIGCGSNQPAESSTGDAPKVQTETLRLARLNTVVAGIPNSISKADGGLRFTSGKQWGYAAHGYFDGFGGPGCKGTVEVRLQVTKGQVDLGLLTDHNEILQEQTVGTNPPDHTLTLTLGSANANVTSVVFRSAAPPGTVSEALIQAVDYVFSVAALPEAVSLQRLARVDQKATVDAGPPVSVLTGEKYAFAAVVPLTFPQSIGPAIVRVHARVAKGQIGVSFLDKAGAVGPNERYYDPSAAAEDYFLAIPNPANTSSLMFRSDLAEPSQILIESIAAFRIM